MISLSLVTARLSPRFHALLASLAFLAALGTVTPGSILAQTPEKVRIYVNEQRISDSQRARLARFIVATQPREKWLVVTSRRSQTVASLINKYLHVFAKPGPGATPRTAEVLGSAVKAANGFSTDWIPAGTRVYLPPVPVRAYSRCETVGCGVRSFNVNSKVYDLMSLSAKPIAKVIPATGAKMASARALRRVRITELVLNVNSQTEKEILQSRGRLFPSRAAIVTTLSGFDVLHLLASPGTCERATDWLDTSPYKALLQAKLAKLNHALLARRASSFPLVIIDWDTRSGHGSKVRKVVGLLLRQLGLNAVLSPFVKSVDLNPMHSRKQLGAMLKAYEQYYVLNGTWSAQYDAPPFAEAKSWINDFREAPESSEQRVPSILMQAVFYKYMTTKSWINLSFYLESSALKVLEEHYMTLSKSEAVFAAGDTGLALSPVMMPQRWASSWPTLMNVTYGDRNGTILGDYSNLQYQNYVTTVAPGCGYQGFTDKGSSFASPYVATALWVQSLIKGSAPEELKAAAIVGSRLEPPLADGVESGGIFDPAFLLAAPSAHYIDRHGTYHGLRRMNLYIGVATPGGTVNFHSVAPAAARTRQTGFAPYPCGSGVCVWSRTWNESRKEYDVAHYRLDTVRFSAVTTNGRHVEANSNRAFLGLLKQLYY